MTTNFRSTVSDAIAMKGAPRTIVLPRLVSDAMQSAKLLADADPKHLEQGGAVFASQSVDMYVRPTIATPENVTPEGILIDRDPVYRREDRVLAEYHVHPRGTGRTAKSDRQYESFDAPSSFDFDRLAKHSDRFFLVRAGNVTYGVLKTKEYDAWYSSLPRDPRTGLPHYDNSLSYSFAMFKKDALSKRMNFAKANANAALKVANKYHLVFYVGTNTSLKRIN